MSFRVWLGEAEMRFLSPASVGVVQRSGSDSFCAWEDWLKVAAPWLKMSHCSGQGTASGKSAHACEAGFWPIAPSEEAPHHPTPSTASILGEGGVAHRPSAGGGAVKPAGGSVTN